MDKQDIRFATIAGILVVIYFSLEWFEPPLDDTDNAETGERSGLFLYTDNLTGCQYLQAGLIGGMEKRVDRDGAHLGCK